MALIIIIALGVVLGLLIFKNGKALLIILALFVALFMFEKNKIVERDAAAQIERSNK